MTKKIFHSILLVAGTVLLASLLVIMGCLYEYFGSVEKSSCTTSWSSPRWLWRKTGRNISPGSPPSATV